MSDFEHNSGEKTVKCAVCGKYLTLAEAEVAPFGHPKATRWVCTRCLDMRNLGPQETK